MWAREFAEPYPYVSTDAGATDTALLAEHRLRARLVVDRPYARRARIAARRTTRARGRARGFAARGRPNDRDLDEVQEKLVGLTAAVAWHWPAGAVTDARLTERLIGGL